MLLIHRWPVTLGVLIGGLLAGAAALHANPAAHAVVPGDMLHIMVYAGGQKHEDLAVTVSPAGTIVLPMIGELRVAGMGAAEIGETARRALDGDYYVDPQVMVAIREHVGKIFVAGEVRRPGVYPVHHGLTVLQACDLAGGTTDFAATGRVVITRNRDGKLERLRVDLAKIRKGASRDVALQNGDRVEVPQRWF